MIKVGKDVENYSKVKFDADGWADAKVYSPIDFDLCILKIKDKNNKIGWKSGSSWDGLKMEDLDEVLYWKKQKEESKGIYEFK